MEGSGEKREEPGEGRSQEKVERGGAWKGAEPRPGGGLPHAAPSSHGSPRPSPSDLALRNCLLTSDLTVRIGDYGLAHSNYKVRAVVTQGWGW